MGAVRQAGHHLNVFRPGEHERSVMVIKQASLLQSSDGGKSQFIFHRIEFSGILLQ